MAVDRLFWDMVGLPVKDRDTLSFRNRRLWTLQTPQYSEHHGGDVADIGALADIVIDRTQKWSKANADCFTIAKMLDRMGPQEHLSEDDRILAICLLVLSEDYETAHRIAAYNSIDNSTSREPASEYGFIGSNGCRSTLIEKARTWLIAKRREGLKLVT